MNLPARLFKYESWNEHSIANLKNSQVYFSDPIIEHEKFDVAPLVLTKHKSWEYEKEWRVLHSKTQVLFSYQPQALTGIYFGAKMPLTQCEIIASFIHIQSPHTVFYKAEKSKSKFRLEFKKMNVTFSGHSGSSA